MERLHQTLGTLVRMLRSKQLKEQREWDKLLVMAAHAVNNSVCVANRVTTQFPVSRERCESPLGHTVPLSRESVRKGILDG